MLLTVSPRRFYVETVAPIQQPLTRSVNSATTTGAANVIEDAAMKHATAASSARSSTTSQDAVAAEPASLFPETVKNANASSSSDSQYHHLPSPRDVPLIFDTGASTTMMPHTRFHRTVRHTTTAVTMANGDSTRSTGVGEAIFPVVGHGITLQSLVVIGLRAGLIAAGQVAKQHDIQMQTRHMFVVPRGPCSAARTNVVLRIVMSTITVILLVSSLPSLFYTMSSHRDIYI
jgi:hypothetical protein